MSKLPPLPHWCEPASPFAEQMQAYATAATEPLLQRIAELEQRNSDLHEDVQRFKKHALNEKAARLELERHLEEAQKDAERLDFIEKNPLLRLRMFKKHWSYIGITNYEYPAFKTAREAIDAAMQKGQA